MEGLYMENNKSSAGIIAAVLAVLVIGGGTLWFINRDSAETDTQANNQTQQTEAEAPTRSLRQPTQPLMLYQLAP